MVAVDEPGDELDHLVDVAGGARVDVGAADAEGVEVIEEAAHDGLGELLEGDALAAGAIDGLVVDIGQVHDELDVEALPLEVPMEQVVEEEGAVVPDVRELVDGGTAGVHAGGAGLDRIELVEGSRQGVVEPKCHSDLILGVEALTRRGGRWDRARRRPVRARARGRVGSDFRPSRT